MNKDIKKCLSLVIIAVKLKSIRLANNEIIRNDNTQYWKRCVEINAHTMLVGVKLGHSFRRTSWQGKQQQ